MKNTVLTVLIGFTIALSGCGRNEGYEIPTGSDVTVQKKDGVSVTGRLVEVKPQQVVLQSRDGVKLEVPRSQIASLKSTAVDADPAPAAEVPAQSDETAPKTATGTAGDAPDAPPAQSRPAARTPEYREVTLPAGTLLPLSLTTAIASDTSRVEDPVRATLRRPISIEGVAALPTGTVVLGHVASVKRSAKVKGRASIGVRFNTLDLPGDGGRERISTATVVRVAPATKKKDATKIGVGAGAGAVIGGIVGGGGGAAKGAAIGGGAGTATVLATRGDEVRLPAGTPVSVKLTAPLTLRVPLR